MLTIGLTGGIGSGKSIVANYFRDFGITTISADHSAQALVEPDGLAYREIIQHFGKQILNNQGKLDRNRLREIIFSDRHEKIWLESLLHPLIQQQIQVRLSHATSPYCIVEIPLLTTDKSFAYIHRILVVDCDENTQIARVQQRDKLTIAQVRKIINNQPTRDYRLSIADDRIDNNGDLSKLQQQVQQLHQYYLSMAR